MDWVALTQKCIVSQFWRLGVQDYGVGRFGFVSRPLSLVCPLFSLCPPMVLPLVCVCVPVSSCKHVDGHHVKQPHVRPTHMTSLYLYYFFKGPISKYSHI